VVIKAKLATLNEVQTVYSVEDVYDLIEMMIIDGANDRRDDGDDH
jgi:hypothetical protein